MNAHHPCCRFRLLVPMAILGAVALFTYAVYSLWNGVLAEVVGVKTITYWQALGLLVLSKILFGGFPGRGRGCGPRGRMGSKHWESLNPEQREHMREEMRRRFGEWPRPPWCDTKDAEPETPPKGNGV